MGRKEKPLDPAAGPVQRFAYELRKLRDEAGAPTYREMARGAGYSGPTLSAAAAGERLPTLPVLMAYVTACGGDPDDWTDRWRTAVAESAAPEGQDDTDSPYPGLARFDTADRDHFHGRDDLVADLLELTARRRVCAVVGASGSGKSSLLRAGLVPALRESEHPALRPAAIRVLTPGTHPARTHAPHLTPHTAPGDTLVVVDQFEETFALCADPAERERFVGQLLAAQDPANRLRVLLAVRADFYGRCADHGPLAEALRDSTLLVGPLSPPQLREAVVRPAAARRLIVERTLTARIVADVDGEPGGLPLMAHALREVWRRRNGKTLTLAAYEAVGGVHGAVAHTAETAYADCTPAEQAAARHLLLRLVTPGDGTADTRRPVERTELGSDPTTAHVLERLVRARLLTVDGDTVDLAHEALIGAWPRLRGWLTEDRERLRAHRRLTQAARTWTELAHDDGALYRGVRLSEAREVFGDTSGELTEQEREFLAASIDADDGRRRAATRATRRMRALTAGLAALLCLAVVAGLAAWRESGVSDRRRDEAEARRVAALADTLRGSEPRTAMRLALAAWRTADLPETRQALRTAAAQSEQDTFVRPENPGREPSTPVWLSRDGRILTSAVGDTAEQWDVRTHRRLRAVPLSGAPSGIADVSPDGRTIATRGEGGRGLVVTDVADGRTRTLPTGSWTNTDIAFGPRGDTFVLRRLVPNADGRAIVEVWDVRRQRLTARYDHGVDDGGVPVSTADGKRLAWCTDSGGELRVLDVPSGRLVDTGIPRGTARTLCGGDTLVFTPDGRAVATGTAAGVLTWDFVRKRERPPLPVAGGALSVEFAGAYALSWTTGSLQLWRTDLPTPGTDLPRQPLLTYPVGGDSVGDFRLDLDDGVLRYRQGGRTDVVSTVSLQGLGGRDWRKEPAVTRSDADIVAVDPAGRTRLASDGTLVTLATGRRRTLVTGEDFLAAAAFSPDGRRLAVSDGQGRITLWNVTDGGRIAVLRASDLSNVDHRVLAFSRDGALLAATVADGTVRVWETASPGLAAAVVQVGDRPVRAVGFDNAGRLRVETAHLADRAWELVPERAARRLCALAGGGLPEAEWRRSLPSVPYRDACAGD
ncbi:hypothetical protein ACIQAC_07835 [Streptomyces sp. NPDC088387]|uniref:nSTAND1 domain-containing NTPase n=1 Tax=Streptomyces sp. NPDC088387 TaxID=3365859 RepID=UPI00381749D7